MAGDLFPTMFAQPPVLTGWQVQDGGPSVMFSAVAGGGGLM